MKTTVEKKIVLELNEKELKILFFFVKPTLSRDDIEDIGRDFDLNPSESTEMAKDIHQELRDLCYG